MDAVWLCDNPECYYVYSERGSIGTSSQHESVRCPICGYPVVAYAKDPRIPNYCHRHGIPVPDGALGCPECARG